MRPAIASTLLAGLLGGLLGACSWSPAPQNEEPPATWPLTGLPREAEDDRPIVVVKVDNTDAANPQVGLEQADLVVEELVEGGLTRLAAFYQSQLPERVGPVRSMRASDIPVVKPTGGIVITSGAAGVTKKLIEDAAVPYLEEKASNPGFERDSTRRSPYNLFADPAVLAADLDVPASVPGYLPWGSEAQFAKLPGRRPVKGAEVRFSPSHLTQWAYRKGRYVAVDTPTDRPFRADSVLILRVVEGDAGYLDPAGNKVPETVLTGSGEAVLLHRGRGVSGTWHKGGPAEPITLTRADGKTLTVPEGRVWLELVPIDGEVVTEN